MAVDFITNLTPDCYQNLLSVRQRNSNRNGNINLNPNPIHVYKPYNLTHVHMYTKQTNCKHWLIHLLRDATPRRYGRCYSPVSVCLSDCLSIRPSQAGSIKIAKRGIT